MTNDKNDINRGSAYTQIENHDIVKWISGWMVNNLDKTILLKDPDVILPTQFPK